MKIPNIPGTAKRDLIICVGVLLGLFFLSAYLDLMERWHVWSSTHEDWELDEIFMVLVLSSAGLGWYSFRRWRESYREAAKWVQINHALAAEIAIRQEVEKTLRASESRLQQASQLAKIGYCVWDSVADRCVYCSDEYASIHGLTPSEYIARASAIDGSFSLTHADDQESYKDAVRALRSGQSIDIEYRTITPNGEIRYVRELAKPVFDAKGIVVQEISTSQDITEMKLAAEKLRQAQKMEAVGQLTGGVAHDFNNLLAVIMGNAELLTDRLGNNDKPVQAILRASTRGSELTQRLLAFSRQQALKPQALDLGALVAGMSGLMNRTLGATIDIETICEPDLWRASADPGQVENALLNMAINARDAMAGGGKLTIECANARIDESQVDANPELKAGDFVWLSVSDEGCGMSADVKARAFEPFFTTKDVGQGSGLGLSMVYGFAKQSGGHATIYSDVDRGTTVRLYLPRTKESARHDESTRQEDIPPGQNELILVVEDDSAMRALVVRMLQEMGYKVVDVPDASAAHQALAGGEPVDLVLSDVILPGGTSGPDFAAQARTNFPGLKFIFMSGYSVEAADRNGFLKFEKVLLNKPFQRLELAKAVREALG